MTEISEALDQHAIMDHEGIPSLGKCGICKCVHGLPHKHGNMDVCDHCWKEIGEDTDSYEKHRLRDRRKKR